MAWLGLVPREHSCGASTSRGAITKPGNGRARRLLIESAWTDRLPARIASGLPARSAALAETVKAIAWKAQVRLCARCRRLRCAGKPINVVTVAIRPRAGRIRLGHRNHRHPGTSDRLRPL